METCIQGLSREVWLTPPPPLSKSGYFPFDAFQSPCKCQPQSPRYPSIKMIDDGFLHVTIWQFLICHRFSANGNHKASVICRLKHGCWLYWPTMTCAGDITKKINKARSSHMQTTNTSINCIWSCPRWVRKELKERSKTNAITNFITTTDLLT